MAYKFELADLYVVNGAQFETIDEMRDLYITVNITSKIKDFPYSGRFIQTDLNVKLKLDKTLPTEQLDATLPATAAAWVKTKYPDVD